MPISERSSFHGRGPSATCVHFPRAEHVDATPWSHGRAVRTITLRRSVCVVIGRWRITVVICSVNGRRDREDLSPVCSMDREKKTGREKGKRYDDNARNRERRRERKMRDQEEEKETESPRTRKPVYTRRDEREVWPLLTLVPGCWNLSFEGLTSPLMHTLVARSIQRWAVGSMPHGPLSSNHEFPAVVRNIQTKGWWDTGSTDSRSSSRTTTPEERVFTFIIWSSARVSSFFTALRITVSSRPVDLVAPLYIIEDATKWT